MWWTCSVNGARIWPRAVAGLVIAACMGLVGSVGAVPIGTGNTGADWKKACTGTSSKTKCCQGKFDDCTSTTKPGEIAYGKCKDAHKTCVSAKAGAGKSGAPVAAPANTMSK